MGNPARDSIRDTQLPSGDRLNLRVLCYRTDPARDEPVMLARELIAQGRFAEAVELTTRSLEADPEDVDLLLTHGVALRGNGQLNTAQLALTRAAKADPDWSEPWRHLAEVLHARGRIAQAYAVAERGLELDPSDDGLRSLYELGELEQRAERYIDGDRVAEDPAMLAQALLARGRVETAFELTRAALMEELDDEDLMVAHATAARTLGDLDEAISVLTLAALEAPDFAEVWKLLALCHEERGEPDRAREAAESGLRASPGDRELKTLHDRLDTSGETLVTL
ncbi:MAG: tetratricopeptide repeat protein [Sandaracinaceae bacterium]|nr:tetratricopeptide repeat protein [Sandaracinaceae bacterium]